MAGSVGLDLPRRGGAGLLVVLTGALAVRGLAQQILGLARQRVAGRARGAFDLERDLPHGVDGEHELGHGGPQRPATTWIVPSDCPWAWTWDPRAREGGWVVRGEEACVRRPRKARAAGPR